MDGDSIKRTDNSEKTKTGENIFAGGNVLSAIRIRRCLQVCPGYDRELLVRYIDFLLCVSAIFYLVAFISS